MTRVLSLVLALALSGCAAHHVAYTGTALSDTVSTHKALQVPGVVETNPILGERPSTLKVLALKAAIGTALWQSEKRISNRLGRELRWWERWLLWGPVIAIQSWATVHNFRLAY